MYYIGIYKILQEQNFIFFLKKKIAVPLPSRSAFWLRKQKKMVGGIFAICLKIRSHGEKIWNLAVSKWMPLQSGGGVRLEKNVGSEEGARGKPIKVFGEFAGFSFFPRKRTGV